MRIGAILDDLIVPALMNDVPLQQLVSCLSLHSIRKDVCLACDLLRDFGACRGHLKQYNCQAEDSLHRMEDEAKDR